MRRVDGLVTRKREPPQEAVQVALSLRTEVELRLLDQKDETAETGRAAGLERLDDRERLRCRRAPVGSERSPEDLGSRCGPRALGASCGQPSIRASAGL